VDVDGDGEVGQGRRTQTRRETRSERICASWRGGGVWVSVVMLGFWG
jgi:hypothetical protein